MAAATRIELLGRFAVEVGGTAIPDSAWRLRKSRSVLKALALAPGRALHPEQLKDLLWPGRNQPSAANNLRQAVYHARRALDRAGADGAALLGTRGELLALAPEIELDLDAFEAAAARAEATHARADLEAAVAAYGGELLPEDLYEDWAAERRRALAERFVALLLALAAAREPAEAIDVLHRVLLADPLNEDAHRALMRAYADTGRRGSALAQYDLLREALADAMAADPEPATRALYRELLAQGAPEPAPAAGAQPAQTLPARPTHNLPWQPTSFIGRERELEQLDQMLASRRLVTLTGPGGCGKTRLALEVARRRVTEHPDGAWLIELAGIADAGLVGQAAAHALGVDLDAGRDSEPALARHLAERELLLVLDNCEHLLQACARLTGTLLQSCPGITVLATSREPLHLPGEVDWRVPSLRLSEGGPAVLAGELAGSDAVRLFCDRATTANPHFSLSDDNAPAVAEICFRLDGLPLAIELAAARITTLSPAQIVERLEEGLAVLRSTRRGTLTRQQTLESTLDWSHDLLDAGERTLFRRLAVFAGGFELEAAEAVCAAEGLEQEEILDLLTGLVEKSLVSVDDSDVAYRYRLLVPVRQYAAARLRAAQEAGEAARLHAEWFAAIADSPGGRVTDADPATIDRLERDHDNLRRALAWLLEHVPERGLEMAAAIGGLWLLRGYLREGCNWLDEALAAAPGVTIARCEALHARQALDRRRSESYDHADSLSEERVAVHHLRGDRFGECIALLDLIDGYLLRGRFDTALDLSDTVAELALSLGSPGLRGAASERTGLAAAWRHDLAAADAAFDQAMALFEAAADEREPLAPVIALSCFRADSGAPADYPLVRFEETTLHFRRHTPRVAPASLGSHRAYLRRAAGDYEGARAALDAALELARAAGSALDVARLTAQRGALEARAGDLDAAEAWLRRSLDDRRRLREHRGILLSLANLGVVAAAAGDGDRAEALLAEAGRMADEAVDGPGTGAVLLARAEIARRAGRPDEARQALAQAMDAFYARVGLTHPVAWFQLQHAHLSLEVEDLAEARARLDAARTGFADCALPLGLDCCDALDDRLRAVNASPV